MSVLILTNVKFRESSYHTQVPKVKVSKSRGGNNQRGLRGFMLERCLKAHGT